MKSEQELKEYGLSIWGSDAPDREKIDFSVHDNELDENVAWVWGKTIDDVEVDCSHPVEPEFYDEEHVGECPICGATCSWHTEIYGGDNTVGKDRVVTEWHKSEQAGGLIREYIKEAYGSK